MLVALIAYRYSTIQWIMLDHAWGKLSAVAGHHSFFRAVKKLEFKTVSVDGLGSGMGKW